MFETTLVLNDGTADKSYSLRSIVDGKSIRGDSTAPLGQPKTVTISHGKRNPKDPKSPDRHLVRTDFVKHDVDGSPQTLSAYIVIENPVDGTFTTADAYKAFRTSLDVLGEMEAFEKIIANEP